MAEFKTPTAKRTKSRLTDNPELGTPIKIPNTPSLKQIGYGCGVTVFTLERSPKVGFHRSPWAVKKRNREITNDKKYNERICFEAEILRKLNHPNIVGFRAFTEGPSGEPCLAMEQLDISLGDALEERLMNEDSPLPAKDILKIGFEVVKGLEYLHNIAHILHGDVKSYNILVSQDYNRVKLCDFGVSVPLTESMQIDTSKGDFMYIGTECWSAPEIIDEEGPVTDRADIWAYGLVIWEMIALSPPHVQTFKETGLDCTFGSETSDNTPKKGGNSEPEDHMDDSFENYTFGTRPPLPAIELGPQYQKVLEIFLACTTIDYKYRPSAKGLVNYFQTYVYNKTLIN